MAGTSHIFIGRRQEADKSEATLQNHKVLPHFLRYRPPPPKFYNLTKQLPLWGPSVQTHESSGDSSHSFYKE